MGKECRLSLISFLTSTAILGVFFFSLLRPFDLKGWVLLTLMPVFMAVLGVTWRMEYIFG